MDTKLIAERRDKLACEIHRLITTFENECAAVVQSVNLEHHHVFGNSLPQTGDVEIKVGLDI